MTLRQPPLTRPDGGCESVETERASKPWKVDDGLWTRIEPLVLVVQRRYRHPGRRRLDDRHVLCGIVFVLHTGIPWRSRPQAMGFGSGMTGWIRLRDCNEVGVRQRVHELLVAELRTADLLDLSKRCPVNDL